MPSVTSSRDRAHRRQASRCAVRNRMRHGGHRFAELMQPSDLDALVGCLSERRGCCASAWECLLEDSRRLLPPLRRFALRVPRRTPVNFGRTVPSKRQMLRGS